MGMAPAARSLALVVVTVLATLFLQTQLPILLQGSTSEHRSAASEMFKGTLQIASRVLPRQFASRGIYSSSASAASHTPLLHVSVPRSSAAASTTARTFATTTPNMASKKSILDAIKDRRTIYALNKNAPISDDAIEALVKEAVLHVPSSFNSQSTRLVLLLKEEHERFWTFVKEVLKPMVPEGGWATTENKVNGFAAGYGTILFFEDPDPVHALQKQFPLYADHFPDWSEHTNAMHQYALWLALEAEGFGANLQHYNPVIDQKAQTHWKVPLEWKLRAQLVFGGKAADAGEKTFKPVEGERLFVYGK